VEYYPVNANGTLGAAIPLDTGGVALSMTTGRVNGDTQPDLIVSNDDATISVLQRTGSGPLTRTTLSFGALSWSVDAADVDGDGDDDVVVTTQGSPQDALGVIENYGGALGVPALFLPPNNTSLSRGRMADMTGDGRIDAVMLDGTNLTVYPGGTARAARVTSNTFNVGNHTVNATFQATSTHAANFPLNEQFSVTPAVLPITLSSTPNPSTIGQSVTITADVAAPANSNIYVNFFDSVGNFGAASVVNSDQDAELRVGALVDADLEDA
jgi:hypothetical protein